MHLVLLVSIVLSIHTDPPNESFFGPTGVQNLNGISIGSAVFAQLIIVSNRQTDRNRQTDDAVSIATCDMLFLHEYI